MFSSFMGMRRSPRIWPSWMASAATMRAANAHVLAHCWRCSASWSVDLDCLIAERGPAYALVNAEVPCANESCPGSAFFTASLPGSNVPHTRLAD